MQLTIYNTPLKKKKPFEPLAGKKVGMYVCGVTVYDMCHVGHARSLLVFDVIARYLRRCGYDLTYVRNFTDIDDKIIARANTLGIDYREVADRYIEEFATDMKSLGVLNADIEPKATDHIPQIIDMVRILQDKGYAYPAPDGSVYFSVAKFRTYGGLSGRRTEEMIAGARVDIDEMKRDPLDFALWKRSKEGEPWWESPWSRGRPGWHIECSAMSTHYLGPTLDIHGGGRDLVFPHHENETAQSEAAFGVPFVRYWVHNGFVTVAGEKMSKSLGNFMTIRDLLKDVHPEVLRLLVLSHHYRSPIDFSKDAISVAKGALVRFYEMLHRVSTSTSTGDASRIERFVSFFTEEVGEAMADDFNTARCIAALHELTTEVNRLLDNDPRISKADRAALDTAVAEVRDLFGILREEPAVFLDAVKRSGVSLSGLSEEEIERLVEERNQARKAKDFRRADEIRDMLKAKGIVLKDTPGKTIWEKSM
ncbi:MAG TPA: cysteine--tRNA ligase [Deltaproteobacteria bacterium]|nr:cysteine--tRNA ligase [Deltaproteobacteria bacterium]HOM28449.1 cysteine--tRNA ligase [Deltaproteobacteria bacterium]HPP79674.1 cysteine--tRNA ligase [Deltaproteobacteria bacterium]